MPRTPRPLQHAPHEAPRRGGIGRTLVPRAGGHQLVLEPSVLRGGLRARPQMVAEQQMLVPELAAQDGQVQMVSASAREKPAEE